MKKHILLSTFILFCGFLFGQKKSDLGFDIKDFQQKADVAEWLVEYDKIAWWTSDSISAQPEEKRMNIGKEWFCFQAEDENWHAVYGRYENGNYTMSFHYIVDTNGIVKRTFDNIDTSLLNGHSRALITSKKQLGNLVDSLNLAINPYIKKNQDGTYNVWLLPAFQPTSYAVYGGEYVYKIAANGNEILEDQSYFQGKFKAYKVTNKPIDIWLDYSELEKPTVGSIFFVWYYKRYFTNIFLVNKNFTTTAYKMEGSGYTWLHIDRSKEKSKGKKKKSKKE